jgi:uncharacterized protein YcaQ
MTISMTAPEASRSMTNPTAASALPLALTRDEARYLAVIATGLDRRPYKRRITADDILATIQSLGMVQLDTISVISRSHETVLWSRLGPYDTARIAELYDPGLALTEYLAHAAAIIPVESLALFRSRMENARGHAEWSAEPGNRALMDRVLAYIEENGPTASRHFERPDDGRRAEQWEWYGLKPERRALDALWVRGETVLRRRDQGFSRVFDLPERVIPGFWHNGSIDDEERDRIFIRKALSALGVATGGWASDYFRTGGPSFVSVAKTRTILAEMENEGTAIRVTIPGIDEPAWLDAALAGRLDDLRAGKGRPTLTTLLSPFDNLIWERDRDERLFDFHYRIEVYTPAPKRVYGYYSLPILHRGRIVGRLDPSYSRKERLLTVKALHLEPWVKPTESLARAISGALDDLVTFLGGDAWVLLSANPPQILPLMR